MLCSLYSIIYIMTGWSRDDEFNNFSHFIAVTSWTTHGMASTQLITAKKKEKGELNGNLFLLMIASSWFLSQIS